MVHPYRFDEICNFRWFPDSPNDIFPQKSGQNKIDSNILSEQNKIQESLGMNVNIQNKKNNKGKITFEYKELDQLNKIIEIIKTYY